jgi:hypothetical protein
MIQFPGVLLCFREVIRNCLHVQIETGGLRGMSTLVSISYELRFFFFVIGYAS